MTEPESDNNPVIVKSISLEIQDYHQTLSDGNADDFFVCRKCNKLFNNLSEYVEHKVKEENFSLSQTRSKSDNRIVLPRLVQKGKTKGGKVGRRGKKPKPAGGTLDVEEKPTGGPCVDPKPDTNGGKKEPFAATRGVFEISPYSCKLCSRTFKREATLKWHMEYGHKSKDSSGEDSGGSENEMSQEAAAEKDEDYSTRQPYKPDEHLIKDNVELEPQEILIVLEDPSMTENKSSDNEPQATFTEVKAVEKAVKVLAKAAPRKSSNKSTKELGKDERPYTCKVCGRGFKEQTVLKAHALVHSDHRSFACTVEDCPYAFKTKGGLVRHMRRHTGDRPFSCERCGRSFAESGSLTRHLKARRNCSTLTDKAYPRYMKSWTYHPNIPAVADPSKRDPQRGRSTLGQGLHYPENEGSDQDGREFHYIITTEMVEESDEVSVMKSSYDATSTCTSVFVEDSDSANTLDISTPNTTVEVIVGKDVEQTQDAVMEVIGPEACNGESQKIMHEEAGEIVKDRRESSLETPASKLKASSKREDLHSGSENSSFLEIVSVSSLSEARAQPFRKSLSLLKSLPQHAQFSQPCSETGAGHACDIIASPPSASCSAGASISVPDSSLGVNIPKNHQSKNDDEDLMELRANAETESLKLTQCHVCKKDFEALEGLEIHLRTHLADEASRCGLCHFTAHGREELRQHILAMHHQSLNDIETSVLAMEVQEESLRKGETVQSRQITLRNALTAVKQLYSLKKLKNPIKQEKPSLSTTGSVQCMVCSKVFRGSSYLRQHMRTHTGDRPHQCHHCSRSFTSRDILKKHMYVHQEHKDYKCGECGKMFKRLGHVQQHLRSHSQERAFRCTVCEKLFKTQHSLKVHLRTHSGINPYKCHICNSHFRERGSLQRHMRLHTGEKPFKCHRCNRAFSEQGTLCRHLKAKVPCSINRDVSALQGRGSTQPPVTPSVSANSLAQFASMVGGTQHLILPEEPHSSAITTQVVEAPEFLVQTGQQQEVGSEYVVLQSSEGASEIIENVVAAAAESGTDDPVLDLSGAYPHEQIPGTETLHIVDHSTGEAVIIVAEKAIVDLVREQHLALQATEGGCSMAKIEEILMGAREGLLNTEQEIREGEGADAATDVKVKQEEFKEEGNDEPGELVIYNEQDEVLQES